MSNPFRRTAVIVWAFLCLLSFSSVMVSGGVSHAAAGSLGTLSASMVLVIAFLKVRMVVMHFMEVGHSPLPLRLAFEAWIIGALSALLVLLNLNTV
jgi:hypothetical protein